MSKEKGGKMSKEKSVKPVDSEPSTIVESFKGVSNNLQEYFRRVTKVQSVNEWIELNQQLLDSPFAGLDQVRQNLFVYELHILLYINFLLSLQPALFSVSALESLFDELFNSQLCLLGEYFSI